jgi:hypothetical protein
MKFKLINDHQRWEILIQSGRSDITLKKHLGSCQWFWARIESANSRINISLDVYLWRHQTRERIRAFLLITFGFHQSLLEWRGQTELTIEFHSHKCLNCSQCFFLFICEEQIISFCCGIKRNVACAFNKTLHTTGQKDTVCSFFNVSLCKQV